MSCAETYACGPSYVRDGQTSVVISVEYDFKSYDFKSWF